MASEEKIYRVSLGNHPFLILWVCLGMMNLTFGLPVIKGRLERIAIALEKQTEATKAMNVQCTPSQADATDLPEME